MPILALDLGGTKLASGVFQSDGKVVVRNSVPLDGRSGKEVATLIGTQVRRALDEHHIETIGVSVPGISRQASGTVWAPNIEGWHDFPLLECIQLVAGPIPVQIDSDRACSIFGEQWQGSARGCRDAIFIAVGTGIGAGIVANGQLLRGSHDIAGAIGWMALPKSYESKYAPCGCFEFYASGAGIPKFTRELLDVNPAASSLRDIPPDQLTAHHVFDAYDKGDAIAQTVIHECVSYWGMASANLVSIFNPEMIIFGGGIFGPAAKFLQDIRKEAGKWAQPISITQVRFSQSTLGSDAALFGAAYLAKTALP